MEAGTLSYCTGKLHRGENKSEVHTYTHLCIYYSLLVGENHTIYFAKGRDVGPIFYYFLLRLRMSPFIHLIFMRHPQRSLYDICCSRNSTNTNFTNNQLNNQLINQLSNPQSHQLSPQPVPQLLPPQNQLNLPLSSGPLESKIFLVINYHKLKCNT